MVDPKLLRELAFFDDLTDEELEVMSPIMEKKSFTTGETIFGESEEGESLYIIRKGELKACRQGPDGELYTLTLMKDGEIFGEMSFLDGRQRSATLVSISEMETFVLERNDFEGLLDKNPRIVFKVMKSIIFTVHSIVRGMNTRYMEMMSYMWGRRR